MFVFREVREISPPFEIKPEVEDSKSGSPDRNEQEPEELVHARSSCSTTGWPSNC